MCCQNNHATCIGPVCTKPVGPSRMPSAEIQRRNKTIATLSDYATARRAYVLKKTSRGLICEFNLFWLGEYLRDISQFNVNVSANPVKGTHSTYLCRVTLRK